MLYLCIWLPVLLQSFQFTPAQRYSVAHVGFYASLLVALCCDIIALTA